MTHASLFSGIGGFDLAARNCGIINVFQCEIDDFCQQILTKNFPETEKYKDVKLLDGKAYANRIDIISGGFPCQPFSIAGKRKGTADDRYLWDEMFRIISEVKPKWIIVENVPGLLTIENGMVFEKCLFDLESAGYETQSFIIPAIAQNAPHRRDRLWIVANSDSIEFGRRGVDANGLNGKQTFHKDECHDRNEVWSETFASDFDIANSDSEWRGKLRNESQTQRTRQSNELLIKQFEPHWYEVATKFCRVDDGLSDRLDTTARSNRIKALGNAIVPQIAEIIFQTILEVENDNRNDL